MINSRLTRSRVLDIFVECNHLRALANRLEQRIELLQEVAMNAGIAASQTGAQTQVISELAKQMSYSSTRMAEIVHGVRKTTGFITNRSLEALRISLQTQILRTTLNRMPGTHKAYQRLFEVFMDLHQTIDDKLSEGQDQLQNICIAASRLDQHLVRSWTIAVNFRIEALRLSGQEKDFYLTITHNIKDVADQLKKDIQQLRRSAKGLYDHVAQNNKRRYKENQIAV